MNLFGRRNFVLIVLFCWQLNNIFAAAPTEGYLQSAASIESLEGLSAVFAETLDELSSHPKDGSRPSPDGVDGLFYSGSGFGPEAVKGSPEGDIGEIAALEAKQIDLFNKNLMNEDFEIQHKIKLEELKSPENQGGEGKERRAAIAKVAGGLRKNQVQINKEIVLLKKEILLLNEEKNRLQAKQTIDQIVTSSQDPSYQGFLEMMRLLESDRLNSALRQAHSIEQVEAFRDRINHCFDSGNNALLSFKPHEILYLNACAAFYPIIEDLNSIMNDSGLGLLVSKNTDWVHVFLGEMQNTSDERAQFKSMLKGGYLYIPSFTPLMRAFKSFEIGTTNGCLYFETSSLFSDFDDGSKTYFPLDLMPHKCLEILIASARQSSNITRSPNSLNNIYKQTYYIPLAEEHNIADYSITMYEILRVIREGDDVPLTPPALIFYPEKN